MVHTFYPKYVPCTYFLPRVCTGMYQVQTDLKYLILSMYLRKKVGTKYILQGHKKYVQVCTEYIQVHPFFNVLVRHLSRF